MSLLALKKVLRKEANRYVENCDFQYFEKQIGPEIHSGESLWSVQSVVCRGANTWINFTLCNLQVSLATQNTSSHR